MHAELYVHPQDIGYQHAYINGASRCSAGIRFTGMASSRTFAVILCVILALLAFVAQDALAARVLGNSRSIFLLGFGRGGGEVFGDAAAR
jgi:tetrahydromethanopterin S-methyltransferase subunit F